MDKLIALYRLLMFFGAATLAGSMTPIYGQSFVPEAPGQSQPEAAWRKQVEPRGIVEMSRVEMSSVLANQPNAGSSFRGGRLIHAVAPIYPPAAIGAHISGTVVIKASAGKDGRILEARAASGPLALRKAAQNAVKRWRYEPTLLHGKPIERDIQINLRFVLGHW